ncbi:MAG: hypothetical protein PHI02_06275 [Sulfurovaceae bacterium]|nr:hypothetical protein [Sulfurovaceae bacterium]
MICFKDTVFCSKSNQCKNEHCPNRLLDTDIEEANNIRIPIATLDLSTMSCGMWLLDDMPSIKDVETKPKIVQLTVFEYMPKIFPKMFQFFKKK